MCFAIHPFIWWIALTGISVVRQWLLCTNLVKHQVVLFFCTNTLTQAYTRTLYFTLCLWRYAKWFRVHNALKLTHFYKKRHYIHHIILVFCTNIPFSLCFCLLRAHLILCGIYFIMIWNQIVKHSIALTDSHKEESYCGLSSFTKLNKNKWICFAL